MIVDHSNNETLKRIAELENELSILKKSLPTEKTVNVPLAFEPIFEKAQVIVDEYFSKLKRDPSKGILEINNERYVLIRASALSEEFFDNIKNLYKDKSEKEAFSIASSFLFDVGHLIGKQDAMCFHKKMNLDNPVEKLAAGPVHFAHSGWAFVDILPESNPEPNINFFLKFNHPYSFEADSWIKSGKKSNESVCVMNAAYSSGWCEESFGIPLTAVEISCRAKGDAHCTFIMAHPDKIQNFIENEISIKKIKYKPQIPYFFERKLIEDKMIQSERLLNSAQMISKLGSWEFIIDTNELIWSQELYNIFEIDLSTDKSNLYDEYISRISKKDLPELLRCIELAYLGEKYTIQHGVKLPNGTKKWVFGTGVPVKDENQKVYKIIGYAQDVTERVSTEIELNKYFKLSMDMLCVANFEGDFVKVSKGWTSTLGYSKEDLIGKPFLNFVHPDDIEATINEFKNIKDGEFTSGFENRYRTKGGGYKLLNWNAAPDQATGLIYCIVRDVTVEREAENELKSALHEKEILLKEVHHRVKNNMQIISSLLNLQTSFINSDETLSLYKESQNRIKSIAAIHELLYQSADFGKIVFKDYLRKLIPDLIYAYLGHNSKVNYTIETDAVFDIDTSVPLGLIVNEVISNSLKHGLKNTTEDHLFVRINKLNESKYELLIGDNGIGYVQQDEESEIQTFGLMLIYELASQINGKSEKLSVDKGTSYRVEFSVEN
jgi:PAS domain S-box-containing protein